MVYYEIVDLDYPLPNELSRLLIALTQQAKQNETLDVTIIQNPSESILNAFDYRICSEGEREDVVLKSLIGRPIESLERLGFLDQINGGNVFLFPQAFNRAKYEQKTKLGKFSARIFQKGKDVILGISLALSMFLSVIKILEIIGD
jgi:hypothetical protein